VTVPYQDIGDSGLGAFAGASAVADVGHAGGGRVLLDQDLAVQVSDGDLVAVDDDHNWYLLR
jgi:hypothetical protein